MNGIKRWSAKRKQEFVLRLPKGESLDALTREPGQAAANLSTWLAEFLEAGLKRRSHKPKVEGLRA